MKLPDSLLKKISIGIASATIAATAIAESPARETTKAKNKKNQIIDNDFKSKANSKSEVIKHKGKSETKKDSVEKKDSYEKIYGHGFDNCPACGLG